MAESKPVVAMNKAQGLELSMTSTGRQLDVVLAAGSGLWRIAYADGKPGGLPEKYLGRYTSQHIAQEDLDKFIGETWDVADEHTKRKSA